MPLLLTVPAAIADDGPGVAGTGLTHRIERAVVVADVDELLAIRKEMAVRGSADPRAFYTQAYVNWRLTFLVPVKQRKPYSKEAERLLKLLLEEQPENAEALALLGSAYGARITGMWSGITLGGKADSALEAAAEIAPDNPRVVVQRGISSYFSPKSFGGGLDRAEEELRRALELFAEEPLDTPWPNWGHVDAWAWLGRVLADRGDASGARDAYRKGLELEPEYHWIRNVLLPELG